MSNWINAKDQLEQLDELNQRGILSENEYRKARRRVLEARTQESVAAPTKVVPKLNLGSGLSSSAVPRLALKKQPVPPISFSQEAAENSSRSYLDGFDDITEPADSCPMHPLAVGSHVEVADSGKRGIVEELEPGDDDVCVVLADGGCQAVFSRKELFVDCSCKSGHTTLLLMQEQPKA